jgi:putative transposase
MKDRYAHVALVRICRLLGVTRQAYYQHFWQQQAITLEQELVLEQVTALRKHHRMMGGRKLYELLQPFLEEHQIKMGRDGLFELLASHNMLVKRKRKYCMTTFSNHWLRKWPNLITGLQVSRVNQVWVSDITYWKISGEHLYISLITDTYSHKIVGYHLASTLETVETIKALQMALEQLPCPEGRQSPIHHSDRGVQYCSESYVKLLQDNNIQISMTQNGDPRENAIAERVNGIIKNEYLSFCKKINSHEAAAYLENAINLYNRQRPHMSIGLLTPEVVHNNEIQTEKLWKSYYPKKSKIDTCII